MPDIDQGWMDVSETPPRIAYTATSGQTAFTVPFPFIEEADLLVYQDDVLLTLTTHYTVAGEGEEEGGTVTLVTGATLADAIVIVRELPFELTTHINLSGIFDTPAVNEQFTRIIMMMQQIDADRVRSLKQPASDETDFIDLPVKADRLGMYLRFNITTGQPEMVAAVSTSVAASAYMLTLMDDPDALTARATLGITDQSAYAGLSNWHHCR